METDILKINTKFTRVIISKLVRHFVKKKTGVDLVVDIPNLEIINSGESGQVDFKLEVNGSLKKDDINKLVEKVTKDE